MEKGPQNILKKAAEKVSSVGKKAALTVGVLTAGFATAEAQTQAPSPVTTGVEQQDSVLQREALAAYEKLVAARDSVLEFNKNIESINQKAISNGAQMTDLLVKENDLKQTLKAVSIDVPTYIEQTGQKKTITGSVFGFVSGSHEVTFGQANYRGSHLVSDKTIEWKNFLNSYSFKYPDFESKTIYSALQDKNRAIENTRNFLSQYKNTKTGKTLDTEEIKIFGANTKGMYAVPAADSYVGLDLGTHLFLQDIVDYDDDEKGTTIKNQLGKNGSNASMEKIKSHFINPKYKTLEPTSIRILTYQKIHATLNPPFKEDAAAGRLTENCHYDMSAYYVCIPVWSKKPIPKLPNKATFISNYIATHAPKDTVVLTAEDFVSKDTVQQVPSEEVAITPVHEEKNTETKQQPEQPPSGGDVHIKKSDNYPRLREVYAWSINPKTGLKKYTLDHYLDPDNHKIGLSEDGITPAVNDVKEKK